MAGVSNTTHVRIVLCDKANMSRVENTILFYGLMYTY